MSLCVCGGRGGRGVPGLSLALAAVRCNRRCRRTAASQGLVWSQRTKEPPDGRGQRRGLEGVLVGCVRGQQRAKG